MDKYNEIMEHIHVDDEMRDRVLSRVDKYFANEYRRRNRRRIYTLGMAAAAVAVIVVSGVSLRQYSLNKGQEVAVGSSNTGETELAGAADAFFIIDCETRDKLESTVGFEIPEITKIPFEVGRTAYTAIGGNLAQVVYYSADESNELIFRKAPGNDDVSGDYNVYTEEQELTVDGITVSLKGNNGLVYLAAWTDSEYAYSISVSQGCSEEAIETMLAEVIG